ncbi:MAG: hypothetical protein MUE41_18650, partial [Gemmatimonadaceae bacterium]|nr:hypothetical protein [Gemmatimonadaceae bacterium]
MPSMTVPTSRRRRLVRAGALASLALFTAPLVAHAQDFEFEDEPAKRTVGFQIGAQRALGDLQTFSERGLGFGVLARQPIKGSRILSIRVDADLGVFTQSFQRSSASAGSVSFDNRFTTFRGLLGAQVTADNETFRPYLHGGAGVGLAQAKMTATAPGISSESNSGVGLAWMAGLGVYRLIGESDREWALDIGARLNGMPSIDQPSVIINPDNRSRYDDDRSAGSPPRRSHGDDASYGSYRSNGSRRRRDNDREYRR